MDQVWLMHVLVACCLAIVVPRCDAIQLQHRALSSIDPVNASIDTVFPFSNGIDCPIPPSSINEFPPDLFTDYERTHGAILLHILGAAYFFTLLAVVCNDYFLPSVECICEDLKISKDVAAATFMATATTTPELFTNVISTFITDSDLGIGTIIGSLMFNTLGVAAIASLAARQPVQLSRWPITRDCILFILNIIVLVCFAWDAKITLGESIVMMVLYVVYFLIIFNNTSMKRVFKWLRSSRNRSEVHCDADLPTPSNHTFKLNSERKGSYSLDKNANGNALPSDGTSSVYTIMPIVLLDPFELKKTEANIEFAAAATIKKRKSLWSIPEGHVTRKIWWLYTWPIKCILTITIPNPKSYRRLYPLTFLMCIIFIGFNSYMIVWMVTVMGFTFSVPESVMGLTFLAAGGCMPEAISSVLMVRKGEGGIGVSNSLGANSLAILMSLGLPWLIRNIIHRNEPDRSYIALDSADIEYTILSLLLATVVLYAVISYAKYNLKRSVGVTLICVYLVFITLCILLEMNILIPTGGCR